MPYLSICSVFSVLIFLGCGSSSLCLKSLINPSFLIEKIMDQRFAKEFYGYRIETVKSMGWAGIKNGQLLALAEKQFDVLITVDRNLPSTKIAF